MKIIFFGTPAFSANILKALIDNKETDVLAIVTQKDKPAGRGQQMHKSATKVIGEKNGIKVIQPNDQQELKKELSNIEKADFFVVVAFGTILDKTVLEMPRICSINIHASLLPKYRGASPIQEALLHGDKTTGITYMMMEESLDSGPTYATNEVFISDKDTLETLSEKLSDTAAKNIAKTLKDIEENKLLPKAQNHNEATYCTKIKKSDGKLDFLKSAKEIINMIRAYDPWPGVHMTINNKKIRIVKAEVSEEKIKAGEFIIAGKTLKIGTGKGTLIPTILKPEGKKEASTESFINGYKAAIQNMNQNRN